MPDKEYSYKQPVGIIGSGSFGKTIAKLLSQNVSQILMYTRKAETLDAIRKREGEFENLPKELKATDNLTEIAENCTIIFTIIPSRFFREMMKDLGPLLRPSHILIHGTKGLDVEYSDEETQKPKSIHTMSEVIEQESTVCRIGCLSGPNLSAEILEGQPAATLLASRYTEVIKIGQQLLRSPKFQVYGTHDIIGAELGGVLKNVIALAAGLLGGKGLGKNIWALLITRGLSEMIHIGEAMGAEPKAFLGVAGIGDLVATASGTKSRNYTAGMRIAKGEKFEDILSETSEMVEGLKTLETVHYLIQEKSISAPIFEITYRVIFKGMNLDRAIGFLMTYPYEVDVDFM